MISMDGLTTLYLMLPTSLIINLEQPRLRLSDDQAWQQIVRIAGVSNSSEFQKLNKETQWQAFIQLKELGASVRQLQRLTGIDRGIIQRARWAKHLPQGACIPHLCQYLSPDIFGYCTAFLKFSWLHSEFQTPFIDGLNLHLVTILLYFAALMVSE